MGSTVERSDAYGYINSVTRDPIDSVSDFYGDARTCLMVRRVKAGRGRTRTMSNGMNWVIWTTKGFGVLEEGVNVGPGLDTWNTGGRKTRRSFGTDHQGFAVVFLFTLATTPGSESSK